MKSFSSFKQYVFTHLFPAYYRENDTYKDGDGKGILERFIEVCSEYLDTQIMPDIDNFMDILDVDKTPDIFLKLKGIEYLNFMGDIYEVPKELRKQRIEELTKKFEIYDNLNEEMQGYSHGMRQKIILCGALLNNPKNWILDEPMTGLDPKASYDLKEMMRKHAKEGNCVFFSTHVLEVAEKLCDRVGIINKGKLIFVGTFEEMKTKLKDNGTLEELFLEITQDE